MDQIILLGKAQIKCSEIKNCGIVTLELPYKKLYRQVPCSSLSHSACSHKWTGDLMSLEVSGQSALNLAALIKNTYNKKEFCFIKKTDCLFITTAEGQTIIFSAPSAEFDIYKKLREIHTFMIEAEP